MAVPVRSTAPVDEQPTVTGALDRMVDAVQGVVGDQIALARLEAETAVRRVLAGGGLLAAGGVFALVGWMVLLAAAHALLRERLHPAASLAILTAVNLAIAAGLALAGRASLRAAAGGGENGHGPS